MFGGKFVSSWLGALSIGILLIGTVEAQQKLPPLLVPVFDEKIFNETLVDVSRMSVKELDTFTDAFVACYPLTDGEIKRRPTCQEKTDRYMIEYQRGRGLDVFWLHFVTATGIRTKFKDEEHSQIIDRAFFTGQKISAALTAAYRSQRNR
jgi:hypothetical protein